METNTQTKPKTTRADSHQSNQARVLNAFCQANANESDVFDAYKIQPAKLAMTVSDKTGTTEYALVIVPIPNKYTCATVHIPFDLDKPYTKPVHFETWAVEMARLKRRLSSVGIKMVDMDRVISAID